MGMDSKTVAAPELINFVEAEKYHKEDLTAVEKFYLKKQMKESRSTRTDLTAGDIVVVSEGEHTGKKVVFLKQEENNIAVVSGIKSINGVSCFKIDERFLFRLST